MDGLIMLPTHRGKLAVSATSRKAFSIFVFPVLVLLAFYFAMPFLVQLPDAIIEQFPLASYLLLAGGVGLGSLYNRHRVVMVALVLGVSFWSLRGWGDASHGANLPGMAVYALVAFVLPLAVLVIAWLPDRRTLSINAVAAFSAIISVFLAGYWLVGAAPELISALVYLDLAPLKGVRELTPVPPLALIAYTAALVALLVKLIRNPTLFESGFVASLIGSALALHAGMHQPVTNIYMIVSGLLLVAAVVQNAYFIAYIDELTQLPGRRALNEELARSRGQYVIAMLDIDHFKNFNDTYGHDIGDQVLRMVASKISAVTGGGKPFRYGGEEFSVVFPGKTCKEVFPHLSRLREIIDESRMILRSKNRPDKKPNPVPQQRRTAFQEVHVTISIGVAETPDESLSPEEVIKAADQALYQAKKKGRNRISQYSSMQDPPKAAPTPAL